MLRPAPREVTALHSLWRARRRGRLGNLEWFDVAYRAYLVALVGGGGTWWLIGLVPDDPLTDSATADLVTHGPGALGCVIAVALFVALRSGLAGGPLAVEEAEIRHVLLAPVPRSAVLGRRWIQRGSTVMGRGAYVGAVAGILAGDRLAGSNLAWAVRLGVVTVITGLLGVAIATIVHARRWPRRVVETIGVVLLGWQGAALGDLGPGPFDLPARVALGELVSVETVPIAIASGIVIVVLLGGWMSCGGLSVERLGRRSALVAQLRFALAVGDLRTVTLLRRQLVGDRTRTRPWFTWSPPRRTSAPRGVVLGRCARGLARMPMGRFARLIALALVAGAAGAVAVEGSTPFILLAALAAFLIGFDATEALAEHLDHPDLTRMVPLESGRLALDHLILPAVLLGGLAVPATAAAFMVHPTASTVAVGAITAVPTLLASGAGAVVATVRGAPDPLATMERVVSLPPEVAGFATTSKMLLPPVVSVLGATPLLLVAAAVERGDPVVPGAIRAGVGSLLVAAGVAAWVRHRDEVRRRWRRLVSDGEAARRASWERRRLRQEHG